MSYEIQNNNQIIEVPTLQKQRDQLALEKMKNQAIALKATPVAQPAPQTITKIAPTQQKQAPVALIPKSSSPIQYDPKIEKIKETIKYMESRGEKDPYSFSRFSGVKELGDALGAYQITEAKLKENSKKFLGREVTREEFLKSSQLQDNFVRAEIKYLQENNFKVNSLFAAHRGGWSDMRRQTTIKRNEYYKGYMDKAMEHYNSIKDTPPKNDNYSIKAGSKANLADIILNMIKEKK